MTRKETLLKESYLLKNRIAELTGGQQIDVEACLQDWRFSREAANLKVYELESRIEILKMHYAAAVEEKRLSEVRDAYFATAEGGAHKARLEASIEKKIAEWEESNRRTAEAIEIRIRQLLGVHWGVKRYDKGYLVLGVIDTEHSTSEQREFYFGQDLEVRYEEHPFLMKDQDRFDCNIGTCGGFALAGGATEGERARFYVGAGRLLGDAETVEWLRTTMRDYNRTFEQYGKERDALNAELNNPFKREEA